MRMLAAALASSLLLPTYLAAPAAPSAGPPAVAAAGEVVIGEITNGGPAGGADAFFELHNRSERAVSLRGWSVYRCDEDGLRAKRSLPEVLLDDVVIAPDARFTAAQMSAALPAAADAVFSQTVSTRGFGLVLIAPDGSVADSVAAYPSGPSPALSECGTADVPVTLAWALNESWQRDPSGRWVRAAATPGAPFATTPRRAVPPVKIVEIAPAGPDGRGDDIVELMNAGTRPVSLAGWRLYRCTALGEASDETLQHTFPDGALLRPGARVLVGGPEFRGEAEVRTSPSLADLVSGVMLTTAEGVRVDGVTVSAQHDTACQSGQDRLDGILDHRTGESWQLTDGGEWVVAPRTPGDANATRDQRLVAGELAYPSGGGVAISEFATDPPLPGGRARHAYVELGNYGSAREDISGWRLIACGPDGFRSVEDLAVVPPETALAPGETWRAALAGTVEAMEAESVFTAAFAIEGAGVWVEDAFGRRVDSVGVYHRNEMDESVERRSPCTKGLALATFAVDRLRGETYQRAAFTGDDATDFVPAPATPGRIDRRPAVEAAALLGVAGTAALDVTARATALVEARSAAAVLRSDLVPVRTARAGATPEPLRARATANEQEVSIDAPAARDDGYGLPYLRLSIEVPPGGGEIAWSGRVVGRTAAAMSVWNPASGQWRFLDGAEGDRTAVGPEARSSVVLSGRVDAAEVVAGSADLLIQVVPRPSAVGAAAGLAEPADYDVALAHITDTQYLSESYPEVYAAEVAWITGNAVARKIGFAVHTGDLIQSWVDPDQREERARREFAIASDMQAELDRSVPNSVLPGNHDNKRGLTNELFNEYFGPHRYAESPWFGESIAPGDNRAGWSSFEAAGARFVVISLPYGYGETEVAWAEQVVADHPDANIVIATHEHVTPKGHGGPAARSNSSRWLSSGDLLWDRIVAPHRNVVLVLSGHFHGVGAIVTEDAGGIPGHTVVEAVADYQEFRTPTGERATGFQRLLQIDLGGGTLAVDTFSVPLAAAASHPYDYVQFVPDNGTEGIHSNERPWNVLERGLQNRYTEQDDAFAVPLTLQFPKAVETDAVTVRR